MSNISWTRTLIDIKPHLDLCCWNPEDATSLISAASIAATHKIRNLSVEAASVPTVWSWLEKSPISLSAMIAWNSQKVSVEQLIRDISTPLKRGAGGVQLYIRTSDLANFTDAFKSIKDEIFFDKKLSIALNLDDIAYNEWTDIFENLDKLKADNLMLIAKNINTFAAQYYNFLDNLVNPKEWGIEFCITTNSIRPLEDIYRLTEKMLPAGLPNLRLIVQPEFMKNYGEENASV